MESFLERLRRSTTAAFTRARGEDPVTVQVTNRAMAQLRIDALKDSNDFDATATNPSIFSAPISIARFSAEGASVMIGEGEHEFVPLIDTPENHQTHVRF